MQRSFYNLPLEFMNTTFVIIDKSKYFTHDYIAYCSNMYITYILTDYLFHQDYDGDIMKRKGYMQNIYRYVL